MLPLDPRQTHALLACSLVDPASPYRDSMRADFSVLTYLMHLLPVIMHEFDPELAAFVSKCKVGQFAVYLVEFTPCPTATKRLIYARKIIWSLFKGTLKKNLLSHFFF